MSSLIEHIISNAKQIFGTDREQKRDLRTTAWAIARGYQALDHGDIHTAAITRGYACRRVSLVVAYHPSQVPNLLRKFQELAENVDEDPSVRADVLVIRAFVFFYGGPNFSSRRMVRCIHAKDISSQSRAKCQKPYRLLLEQLNWVVITFIARFFYRGIFTADDSAHTRLC